MRLVKFSVRKYRSITDTHAFEIGDWTVLVGPNNEGKSNLLRSLALALDYAKGLQGLPGPAPTTLYRNRLGARLRYVWHEDFPLQLQESDPAGATAFRLWFRLTPPEKAHFKRDIGSRLTSDLQIEISVGQGRPKFRVVMPGPANRTLAQKSDLIARFIAERVEIAYIPAVRTAEAAQGVIDRLISAQLTRAERDPSYRRAVARIRELQKPIVEEVADAVFGTLRDFLPDVKNVELVLGQEEGYRALRSAYEVVIDDGNPTPLRFKGDGVQSIAALSLMRAALEARARGRDLILAIEEPEAHLHPGAIHRLRAVLQDIAANTQIVLTTHHPVFVDRRRASNNVIVQSSRAKPAKSIDEVRECLGVHASDNLRHAELVLLVEGENDRLAVESLLRAHSEPAQHALDSGRLLLMATSGADRMPFHASLLKASLVSVHALLDFDQPAKVAGQIAASKGYLQPDEMCHTSCRGTLEAELEDMFDVAAYADAIRSAFGVRLPSETFNRSRAKWSGRMAAAFADQGRDWDAVAMQVKQAVSSAVAANPAGALKPSMRGPFDALVESLEARLTLLP